ncbi:hypothetical protein BC834DRAFT_973185 [Gloeopeniophorella convolvens]|nr:hypothetical protein BC834DRAFT_973185 [Gloeopeniophorella convolvens]
MPSVSTTISLAVALALALLSSGAPTPFQKGGLFLKPGLAPGDLGNAPPESSLPVRSWPHSAAEEDDSYGADYHRRTHEDEEGFGNSGIAIRMDMPAGPSNAGVNASPHVVDKGSQGSAPLSKLDAATGLLGSLLGGGKWDNTFPSSQTIGHRLTLDTAYSGDGGTPY